MTKTAPHTCRRIEIVALEQFDASKLIGSPFVVTLCNAVSAKVCVECNEVKGHIVPKPAELLATVAVSRVTCDFKLDGADVKFLRKCLNMKSKELSDYLGLSAEHFSRMENGREPVSYRIERDLRMHVCLSLFDKVHESLHRKIKLVPTLKIKSVRPVESRIDFRFSLEESSVSLETPPSDIENSKRYANVA